MMPSMMSSINYMHIKYALNIPYIFSNVYYILCNIHYICMYIYVILVTIILDGLVWVQETEINFT